jgi:hypothetical protein
MDLLNLMKQKMEATMITMRINGKLVKANSVYQCIVKAKGSFFHYDKNTLLNSIINQKGKDNVKTIQNVADTCN